MTIFLLPPYGEGATLPSKGWQGDSAIRNLRFPPIKSLLMFLVLVLTGFLLISASPREERVGVLAEVAPQKGLPVEITHAGIYSNIVTREATLNYTVANHAKELLTQLDLFILLLDSNGNVRGGQASTTRLNLPPDNEGQAELRLSNLLFVDQGEGYGRYVVRIEQAHTDQFVWSESVPLEESVAATKEGRTLAPERVAARPVVAADLACPQDFCTTCFDRAKTACGSCGIRSWNCKINSSCECSFTCRTSGPGCFEEP